MMAEKKKSLTEARLKKEGKSLIDSTKIIANFFDPVNLSDCTGS